jgi:N-acetylglucosaminyldiphosphoundecaprenol N-acetyl-beta-D-mannosaminyltransferase
MDDMQKTGILGIPVYSGPLQTAVDYVVGSCLNKKDQQNLRISATGAHGLVTAKKDREFKNALMSCFLSLTNGARQMVF